jgi:hypothetical protein
MSLLMENAMEQINNKERRLRYLVVVKVGNIRNHPSAS